MDSDKAFAGRWEGLGADLKGINTTNGETVVEMDVNLIRPVDIDCLVGDSSLAREVLGWTPSHSVKVCIGHC